MPAPGEATRDLQQFSLIVTASVIWAETRRPRSSVTVRRRQVLNEVTRLRRVPLSPIVVERHDARALITHERDGARTAKLCIAVSLWAPSVRADFALGASA